MSSGVKRKAEDDERTNVPSKGILAVGVHQKRVRDISGAKKPIVEGGSGPVLYWMSRDQRVRDNWALLYALQKASEGDKKKPVAVVFNLVSEFMGAGARQFVFMLQGLQRMQPLLKELNIPFFLVQGDPGVEIPKMVKECNASLLVTDFSPLRLGRQWRESVAGQVAIPMHEVDAHNVVPVWVTSGGFSAFIIPLWIHGI